MPPMMMTKVMPRLRQMLLNIWRPTDRILFEVRKTGESRDSATTIITRTARMPRFALSEASMFVSTGLYFLVFKYLRLRLHNA